MRLHVAVLPALVLPGPHVCVVVDVIRASTTLVALVERGAGPVYIAGDIPAARRAAAAHNGAVLAGEADGLAPSGFDYGNSPVEVAHAPVSGRAVIFVTTNGTAAIRAVHDAAAVLVGSLRNGAAAAQAAAALAAAQRVGLTIVCAGREGGFGIDDAYTAGYLVHRLMAAGSFDLTDGALAAQRLYAGERDALALFTQSAAGRNVIGLGLQADVAYCAERDVSSVVPRLGRELFLLNAGDR